MVIHWRPDPEPPAPSGSRVGAWRWALIALLFSSVALYFASQPALWVLSYLALMGLGAGAVVLVLLWCRSIGNDVQRGTWRRPAWFLAPSIGLLAVVLFALNVPIQLRFQVSREALEQTATTLRNTKNDLGPVQIGSFQVEEAWAEGSAVFFTLGVWIDAYGFVFDPDGETWYATHGVEPFAPGWYQWQD